MKAYETSCDCDGCLLVQMTAGDAAVRQQGWEAWYRRDAGTVLRFVERHCRTMHCQEQSADLLQDCFLIAFRKVSSGAYREQAQGLCAYLYGIAKNLLHELYRIQRRNAGDQELDEEFPQHQAMSIDDQIYLEQVCHCVQEAYQCQPYLQQRVVYGLYAEGKSSDEVGHELGKTAGNTRAIARRAVNEIGKQLAQEHGIHISATAIRTCLQLQISMPCGLTASHSLCNGTALAHMK